MPPATAFIFIRQLLLAFFCLLLIASNAQENNSSNENALSRWLDKKIDIDGKTTEWSENDFINDPKSGLSYIISNDTSSLYICLIATDEIIQTKILNAGFSIFLNSEGKKKKSYAIDFPLPDDEHSIANNPEGLRDLKSLRLINFLHVRAYQLSGLKKGNGLYNIGNTNEAGIKVSLDLVDSGAMIYETIIPFSSILKKQLALLSDDESNIAVCFSINGATKPVNLPASAPIGAVSGNPQLAGKRFTNNNIPATQPSPGQIEKLFQNSKTWKIISLAKHS